ncbi:hypothetical protein HDU96_003040 [Phlyctochytrium bullatum]|nr:hypothetical protein HDU96_003040 [Phlyctochytrium bullatum]
MTSTFLTSSNNNNNNNASTNVNVNEKESDSKLKFSPAATVVVVDDSAASSSIERGSEDDILTPTQPCPYDTASWWSRITFSWVTPLIYRGWKKPLEQEDLFGLSNRFRSTMLHDQLVSAWEDEKAKLLAARAKLHPPTGTPGEPPATPSKWRKRLKSLTFWRLPDPTEPDGTALTNAVKRVFWKEVAPVGFLRLFSDLAGVFSPLLVKYILEYVTAGTGGLGEGLGLAFTLLALETAASVLEASFYFLSIASGIRIRTAIVALLYRKALRVSQGARQAGGGAGDLVSLVSTDAGRIEDFLSYCHLLWTAAVQLPIIVGFLYSQLGWSALVGVAFLVVLGPVQGKVYKGLSGIRVKVAPLSDKRVRLTAEALSSIRVLKFFAWEDSFLQAIAKVRTEELYWVLKRTLYTAGVVAISFGVPLFSSAISFIVYGLTNTLQAPKFFLMITDIRAPIGTLPGMWASYAEFVVAMARIERFLLCEEVEPSPPIDPDLPHAVRIVDGDFTWDVSEDAALPDVKSTKNSKSQDTKPKRGKKATKTTSGAVATPEAKKAEPAPAGEEAPRTSDSSLGPKSILRGINLEIPKGALVAIVGPVGSGKSSLLEALVGEMRRTNGSVEVSGTVGYAPQIPWIQNATLEQNITFGLPKDEERYRAILQACALERDLEILPSGDQTSIGERGINLSGGQKQRVSLARCCYLDPSIVLLDDPLSAVDAGVAKHLFNRCVTGLLAGKTRVFVTHQLHFAQRADWVIVMDGGCVVEQGTVKDLMANEDGVFAKSITKFVGAPEEAEEVGGEPEAKDVKDPVKADTDAAKTKKEGRQAGDMLEEERATGAVKGKVWWNYVVAAGHWGFAITLVLVLGLVQGSRIGSDLWLVWWTGDRFKGSFGQAVYIAVYVAWGVLQMFATYCLAVFMAFSANRAAKVLHNTALARILRAPSSFFDTTPAGRILNRFSKDQDNIDNRLGPCFRLFVAQLAAAFSTFALICYATPYFAIPLFFFTALYWFTQSVYRYSSRELKRLESISRSPLYANFGETLAGLSTIRAYREQNRFIRANDRFADANNNPSFLNYAGRRWIGVRLETMGALLVFFAAIFGVLARSSIDPALLGLSLSYALQITGILSFLVILYTETEVCLNAVERMRYYTVETPVEADAIVPHNRPRPEWPEKGAVEFRDVVMSYAPGLPAVLKGVSFAIRAGEKVGIVGRTGSGKSSLVQALFRMVELSGGEIIIDGVSTHTIGLKDLRSKLAIIPQDPILYSGTYRSNLDPFNQYTDADLWNAIERAGLKAKVSNKEENPEGLEGKVLEGGENLSVGQRQLLCLARAILKKPRLLVLDEATANVDYETDSFIQAALRADFANVTIITIAHRLNTIIDYDKVLVMSDGLAVEYGSPATLLNTSDSIFRSMLAEVGESNFELLKAQAEATRQG